MVNIGKPGNYRTPIGTPLRFLLEQAQATDDVSEGFMGGPMMGPSVASLEYAMRQISSDDLRPHRLGRQMLWLWSSMLEQGMASRRAHPEREAQIIDLHMSEIVADPVGCVRRIYERFALPFSTELEARMRRFADANPRHAHGVHRYSPEAFGLSEPEIRAAFKGYCERFGVEAEPFAA